MADLKIEQTNDGVVFTAKIVPGSSRTALCGLLNGMLKVKIVAAPEKQKANSCLCEFLAKKIGVKKKDVSIVSGKTSSIKKIKISGKANPAKVLAGLSGTSN
ncbi:MAG: DUF167 domain-containing protein [Planctomycetes bacterium]|nr:DUF167 domain-containing protein [Planctomycetota bacterium]